MDVSDNTENTLNIDGGQCFGGLKEQHLCPNSITMGVVGVLRYVVFQLFLIQYPDFTYREREVELY